MKIETLGNCFRWHLSHACDRPNLLLEWLPLAKYSYNANYHIATKKISSWRWPTNWNYNSWIHPTFNVSCLKPKLKNNVTPSTILPALVQEVEFVPKPNKVLQHWSKKLWNQTITKELVKWQGLHDDEVTWVNLQQMQQKFPHLRASCSKRRGGILSSKTGTDPESLNQSSEQHFSTESFSPFDTSRLQIGTSWTKVPISPGHSYWFQISTAVSED